ncbi:MAG: pentapeptide repeat-containing protein [Xanthobacteraceae bacterium]
MELQMKFEIKHRFTGAVLFTAELEAEFESKPFSVQIGAAVKLALKAGAYLDGADLAYANLDGADLYGTYLYGANLAGANLAGANLTSADLARADLDGADLDGAYLYGTNLADAYMARANLDGAYMARANLDGAYMIRANLDGAYMAGANLAGANLDGANLAGANLADADLDGAYMAHANLDGANLYGTGEIKDEEIPAIANIDATILAEIEKGGTLKMSGWHGPDGWCGTTHCRAGWAVHCASTAGRELEKKVGTQRAAGMIYRKSRPGQSTPWFFAPDDQALADIRRCAKEQMRDAP